MTDVLDPAAPPDVGPGLELVPVRRLFERSPVARYELGPGDRDPRRPG